MLELTSIELTKFGSFNETSIFPLPNRPGLYHLQGINQVDSRLVGNGTGKSTIWKGLFWNLFGHTPDGLKAGDVCHWDAEKGARVALNFQELDQPIIWMMDRQWKPNQWLLRHAAEFITDEEPVDLAKGFPNWLKDSLPTSPAVFLSSILMAQEAPTFLDLKPEEQASLFGEILDLDHWLKLSQAASAKASDQDRLNRSMESSLARLEGAFQEQPDYRTQIDNWEEAQNRKLDEVSKHHTQLVNELKRVKAETINEAEYSSLYEQRHSLDDQLVEYRKELKDAISRGGVLKERIRSLLDQIDESEKYLHDFSKGYCPTCGADVDVEEYKREATKKAHALNDEADRCHDEARKLDKLIDRLNDLEETAMKQLDQVEESIRRAESASREKDRRITDLNHRLDQLENEHEDLRTEPNPWLKAQEEAAGRARSTQDAIFKARQGLDRGYELFSLYSFWIRGFKEVRLFAISEALHELEIEVNGALIELGLPGWEIRFDVDRENKKGQVQRGFTVSIKSPHTERPVPWRAWSGGEKQRLRIAAGMGLANLIRSRTEKMIALEVWDEPTKGLSLQGVHDLMTALARRASVEQRVIIVVDHTAPDFGDFAGRATVIKDKDGSHVEVDW